MTATVTQATLTTITAHGHDLLLTHVQVIIIVLLLLLLMERELLRAAGGLRAILGGHILNVATVPLLLACATIIAVRLLRLLHL